MLIGALGDLCKALAMNFKHIDEKFKENVGVVSIIEINFSGFSKYIKLFLFFKQIVMSE